MACARCHDTGYERAPKLSDSKAWNGAAVQSFSTMESHAKNGFLMMPAEGRNSPLTDQGLANAVFYIIDQLDRAK